MGKSWGSETKKSLEGKNLAPTERSLLAAVKGYVAEQELAKGINPKPDKIIKEQKTEEPDR